MAVVNQRGILKVLITLLNVAIRGYDVTKKPRQNIRKIIKGFWVQRITLFSQIIICFLSCF